MVRYWAWNGCRWVLSWAPAAVVAALPHVVNPPGNCYGTRPLGAPFDYGSPAGVYYPGARATEGAGGYGRGGAYSAVPGGLGGYSGGFAPGVGVAGLGGFSSPSGGGPGVAGGGAGGTPEQPQPAPVVQPQPVPEPSTIWIVAGAVAALIVALASL